MNVEYINPFISGSKSVIEMLCQKEVKLGKVALRTSPNIYGEVMVAVGFVGKFKGQVFIEFPVATAKKIAGTMMGGMEINDLDDIGKSAISELGNMIMGTTSSLFAQKAVHIDITPPTLLAGQNIQISSKQQTIIIPLIVEGHGELQLNVSVE